MGYDTVHWPSWCLRGMRLTIMYSLYEGLCICGVGQVWVLTKNARLSTQTTSKTSTQCREANDVALRWPRDYTTRCSIQPDARIRAAHDLKNHPNASATTLEHLQGNYKIKYTGVEVHCNGITASCLVDPTKQHSSNRRHFTKPRHTLSSCGRSAAVGFR